MLVTLANRKEYLTYELKNIKKDNNSDEGVTVGGELLKDVNFSDNQGMAETEKGLHTIMDALSKTEKEYDMKINVKKTKVMRVCMNESKREGGNLINQHYDRRTMGRTSQPVSLFGIIYIR